MREFLSARIPDAREIIPVYAAVSFLIYAWTIGVFLWKLPSWLFFLTPGEILAIFCYAMASSLVESVVVLALLLGISMILPPRLMARDFVIRGTIVAFCGIGTTLLGLARFAALGTRFLHDLIPWTLAGLLLTFLAIFLSARSAQFAAAAAWLSDRMVVFLYIFVPFSLLAVIVVLARNLI